jgi:hypothetical protein
MRAERKCGQLLKAMQKNTGAQGNPGGRGAQIVPSDDTRAHPTLADLGITYDQSSQWQKLADMDEEQFSRAIGETRRRPWL